MGRVNREGLDLSMINRKAKIAIIGQGYVGLPLAVKCSSRFSRVYGLDKDEKKIIRIAQGSSPVIDVDDLSLQEIQASGVYLPSHDMSLIANADVIVICVPTPLGDDYKPNLSHLIDVVLTISKYAREGSLIVNESTSFPGTLSAEIKGRIEQLRPNDSFYFAAAPERIDPGNKEWGFSETPRVVGALDPKSLKYALHFYERICENVVGVPSAEIAETSKLLENAFRQVNIALVTELAQFCERSQIDVHEVIKAAATKPYGFMPFYPGIGVGGHCIPVDPLYLSWIARQSGSPITLIEEADKINRERTRKIFERILAAVRGQSPRILVAGLSYKPGVSDLRESPALEIFANLKLRFPDVHWWDLLVEEIDLEKKSQLEIEFDYTFLMHEFTHLQLNIFLEKSKEVIDCSGKNTQYKGIKPL